MKADLLQGFLRALVLAVLLPCDGEDVRPHPTLQDIRDKEIPDSHSHPGSNSHGMVVVEHVCLCLHLHTNRFKLESERFGYMWQSSSTQLGRPVTLDRNRLRNSISPNTHDTQPAALQGQQDWPLRSVPDGWFVRWSSKFSRLSADSIPVLALLRASDSASF